MDFVRGAEAKCVSSRSIPFSAACRWDSVSILDVLKKAPDFSRCSLLWIITLDNPANKFELNGSSNRGSSTSNFTVVDLVP